MNIKGITHCSNCNNEVKWFCSIPQRLSTSRILLTESYSDDETQVYPTHIKENLYELKYRCKKCDKRNSFTYESDIQLVRDSALNN